MQFTFNHKPEAKQRPRFGSLGKVYNPQRKESMKFKWDAATQMRIQSPERPLESPVCVNMTFHMPMPKSWSQKRKEEQFGKPMTSKPDVDNLMKWILDVLNGIAYQDDRYVTSGCFQKIWGYQGKVEVSVKEQEMSPLDEISILGNAAVKMHLALDEIYEFCLGIKKMNPSKRFQEFSEFLIKKCLDAGLDEIYGENLCSMVGKNSVKKSQ